MSTNIEMIKIVASKLEELNDQCVFVGGATTSLYVDDPIAPEPTASEDVDCVVEVTTMAEYAKIEEKLRKKGFVDIDPTGEDEKAPICRKYLGNLKVDFMPPDPKILSFSNTWYKDGVKNKIIVKLSSKISVSIFSLSYFLASKLEAFNDRGVEEGMRSSRDLEDIAQVLDGKVDLEKELLEADKKVLDYLKNSFQAWLEDENLYREAIGGNIAYEQVKVERVDRIFEILKRIAHS